MSRKCSCSELQVSCGLHGRLTGVHVGSGYRQEDDGVALFIEELCSRRLLNVIVLSLVFFFPLSALTSVMGSMETSAGHLSAQLG